MYRLLIVDDEPGIRRLIRDYFQMQDFLVCEAGSAEEALKCLEPPVDIILLDVNMPNMDGMTFCQKIRDHVDCPILFVTARVEENDRIQGLKLGGDDYILKPFGMEELYVRVMAHLRREERRAGRLSVKFADELVVSYSERKLWIQGNEIELTKTEFDILELLSRNRGQIFGKERIYELVRGYDGEADSSIITEHIRRVRLKISRFTDKNYIETVWGVGYKWIG